MKINKWKTDLTGKVYGERTVLHKSKTKKYYWTCKCSCGSIDDVYYSKLINGKSNMCKACYYKTKKENLMESRIGQKYNKLTILEVDRVENNKIYYKCKCDCGNIKSIAWIYIQNGATKSCGCLQKEYEQSLLNKGIPEYKKFKEKNFKNGTSIASLKQKVSKNNKTGVTGVTKLKSGKYRAYINFQRKQINLGVFDNLEEAKEARLKAEEKYYKPIIEKYEKE